MWTWTLIEDPAKSWSFATDLTSTANAAWLTANIDYAIVVPEPATMSFLSLGALALIKRRRK